MHTHIRAYMHISMHTYIHTNIHICITYIHTYIQPYIHAYIHNMNIHNTHNVHIHTNIHTYRHTYIHANVHSKIVPVPRRASPAAHVRASPRRLQRRGTMTSCTHTAIAAPADFFFDTRTGTPAHVRTQIIARHSLTMHACIHVWTHAHMHVYTYV